MQCGKRKQRYWLDDGENEICICVQQMTLKCMIGMSWKITPILGMLWCMKTLTGKGKRG